MKKVNVDKTLAYGLIIFVLAITVMLLYKAHRIGVEDREELIDIIQRKDHELIVWRDRDSLSNARIRAIEGSRANLMIVADQKDKELQKALKDKKTTTIIKTEFITKFDTSYIVKVDSNCNFSTKIDNGWISQSIKLDSSRLTIDSLVVKNKLQIVESSNKTGTYLNIKQLNPYSTTNQIEVYKVKAKPVKRNILLWSSIGFALGLILTR